MITISLFYNAKEYYLPISNTKSIYDLVNLIINKFNINISLYDLIYDNKILQISKSLFLYALVKDNDNPPFMLREKIFRDEEQQREMCVIIENFPSFRDLTEQIDYFFSHYSSANNNYDIEYKNTLCCIYFYNRAASFAFVQYMNALKYSNDLYYKIKLSINYPNTINKLLNQSSIIVKRLNQSNASIKTNKSIIKSNNKSYLNRYYSAQKFIRNGSPYLSEEERRRRDERFDKKKWISKKGFQCSVGNYSMDREIKNYVNETPSESPLIHKFREINKHLWISRKGFIP